MPDMSLVAQARRRLQAEGAPISKGNIEFAVQELQADPKLREDYSSENDLIGRIGGHLGQPDTYKPTTPIGAHRPSQDPGNQRLSNSPDHVWKDGIYRPVPGYDQPTITTPGSGGFGVHDPSYTVPETESGPVKPQRRIPEGSQLGTSEKQTGSDYSFTTPEKAKATRAKASEMANADRKSGVMFKGGQGATPGTTSQSVSTESEASTGASIPPVKVTDLNQTQSEVNQLASRPRPRPPATQGAGQGGQEQVAAAATPTPATPPAQPGGINAAAAGPLAGGVQSAFPGVGQTAQQLPPQPPVIGPTAGDFDPQAAARLAGGVQGQFPDVGQTAQGSVPAPAGQGGGLIDSIMSMLPEGTLSRAGNVAAIGAPLLAAFAAMKGGRAPLTQGPQGRPIGAPTGLGIGATPAVPVPASPAAMPPTMNPVTAAAPPPGLSRVFNPQPPLPPPVQTVPPANLAPPASPQTIGDVLMASKGQVGMRTVPPAGPVPAAPVAQAAGVGRAGTARLPPTPGKGMTLEDARATSGGGKPQPKPRKSSRARANQAAKK